jgi:hypothetical protein
MISLLNEGVLTYFLENSNEKIYQENAEMLLALAEKGKLNTGVLEFVLKRERVSELEVDIMHKLAQLNALDRPTHVSLELFVIISKYGFDKMRGHPILYDDIVRVIRAIAYGKHAHIQHLFWHLTRELKALEIAPVVNPTYLKGVTLGLFAVHNMFDRFQVNMAGTEFCKHFSEYLKDIIFYKPIADYKEITFDDSVYETKLSQSIKSFVKRDNQGKQGERKALVAHILRQISQRFESESKNNKEFKLNPNSVMIINQLTYGDFGTFSPYGKVKCLNLYYKYLTEDLIEEHKNK